MVSEALKNIINPNIVMSEYRNVEKEEKLLNV